VSYADGSVAVPGDLIGGQVYGGASPGDSGAGGGNGAGNAKGNGKGDLVRVDETGVGSGVGTDDSSIAAAQQAQVDKVQSIPTDITVTPPQFNPGWASGVCQPFTLAWRSYSQVLDWCSWYVPFRDGVLLWLFYVLTGWYVVSLWYQVMRGY